MTYVVVRWRERHGKQMLVIEGNSVYEIDEECLKRRKVPKECEVYEKLVKKREKSKDGRAAEKQKL